MNNTNKLSQKIEMLKWAASETIWQTMDRIET